MASATELAADPTRSLSRATRRRSRAMRILVLGDFTNRANDAASSGDPRIGERAVVGVDVDSLDDLLRQFAPEVGIPVAGEATPVRLGFRSLDDFRPELIYERASVFAQWRDLRERLLDPATFEAAALELQVLLGGALPDVEAGPEKRGTLEGESDDQTIERLLGRPGRPPSSGSESAGKAQRVVSALISRSVAPHVIPPAPRHREVYLRALEDAVTQRMRSLLHAPAFQAIEGCWLSLHDLVSNLETDENLEVHLLDVSKPELAVDLASAGGDLKSSGLYQTVVERAGSESPGGEPWALLVGAFDFGPSASDLGLLAAMGILAASAGGPFIAAASPALLGCRSLAETPNPLDWGRLTPDAEAAWNALRQSPVAPWLGLALPRVLLRLPYGDASDVVDPFPFEELGPERRHEDYLWGNPSFLCARLIGRSYSARGWSMQAGDILDVGGLPAHVFEEDGEKLLQPCAEVYLSERAAEAILQQGIMPLLSFKGRNSVRLAQFRSISDPPRELMGSWGG